MNTFRNKAESGKKAQLVKTYYQAQLTASKDPYGGYKESTPASVHMCMHINTPHSTNLK